jgi:hypothetical protein
MARAAKPKLDPERKAFLERVAKRIEGIMKAKDEIWHTEGMHMLPRLKLDSTFETKALELGVEYMFSEAHVGGRGQLIFCFEPTDSRPWKHIEVDQSKVDAVFPMFGPTYADMLPGESLGDESMGALIAVTEAIIVADDKETVEDKQRKKSVRDEEAYGDNPDFGAF